MRCTVIQAKNPMMLTSAPMSTATALAAVTAVLRDLLLNGIIDAGTGGGGVGPVTVSAVPPDKVPNAPDDNSRLNLFLYQVTPNLGWTNMDMPIRGTGGELRRQPVAALQLVGLEVVARAVLVLRREVRSLVSFFDHTSLFWTNDRRYSTTNASFRNSTSYRS